MKIILVASTIFLTLFTNGTLAQGYPGATVDFADPSNYLVSYRGSNDIDWIVFHTTEDGSIGCDRARNWFKNPVSQVSAHYVICRDGSIYQMVNDKDIAFHAGVKNHAYNYNDRSIGIEHERCDDINYSSNCEGAGEITSEQYDSSVKLVTWLSGQYQIPNKIWFQEAPYNPISGGGLLPHLEVPGTSHTDPLNWDWVRFETLFNLENYEPNNRFQDSTRIEIDEAQTHVLAASNDQDYLTFTLSGESRVLIDLIGLPDGISISLRSNDSLSVIETKVTSSHLSEILDFDVTLDSGKYYVVVNDPRDTFGANLPYSITLRTSDIGTCSIESKLDEISKVTLASTCEVDLSAPNLISPNSLVFGTRQNFRWSSVFGATKYELYIYENNNTNSSLVHSKTNLVSALYSIPSGYLEEGKSYSWKVRAFDSNANHSAFSQKAYFSIEQAEPPATNVLNPPNLSAPGSVIPYDLNTTTPLFIWQEVSDANKYALFVSNQNNVVVYQKTDISGNQISLRLPSGILEDGGRYHWYMVSIDQDNQWSLFSNILYFDIQLPVTNAPVLNFLRYEIDDNDGGRSSGDDDSRAESGELVELGVFIHNTGNSVANNIEATISENSSCVWLEDSSSSLSELDSGDSQKLREFLLDIGNCSNEAIVSFELELSSDEGFWQYEFTIPIYDNSLSIADLKHESHRIEDSDSNFGNNDELLNAGESINLKVYLENTGDETANNISLDISSDSDCLDIGEEKPWGFLDPGDRAPFNFDVSVDGDCQTPQSATIELDIESEKGTWGDSFSLQILPNAKRPDLAFIGSVVLDSSSVDERSLIRTDVAFQNIGDLTSGSTVITYYLSDDSTIDVNDYEFDSDSISELDPQQSKTRGNDFRALIEPGNYFVGGCMQMVSGEQEVANNCTVGTPITINNISGVDIEVWSVTVDERFAYTTSDLGIDSRGYFRNIGDEYTGSDGTRSIYISKDVAIVSEETLVKRQYENNYDLEPGQGDDYNGNFDSKNIPGTYWMTYCIEQNEFEENIENNCLSKAFNVRLPNFDLVHTQPLSLSIENPERGDLVRVEAFGTNTGMDKSTETTMDFYMSDDDTVDFSDIKLGSEDISRRKEGATFSPDINFTAPFEEKQYWLRACIVPTVDEDNTENNCSSVKSFYVGEIPVDPASEDVGLCIPIILENRKVSLVCL